MRNITKLMLVTLTALLAACNQPATHDDYVEIGANETAFLIKLDGNTKDGQGKLNSIEYLEQNKVPVKRIVIPHMNVDTCPNSSVHCWKEVPTARLIKISRTPVSREWTSSTSTGTAEKNEAFHVESNESIDFTIGATITAHVAEDDTAKFLYFYAGSQLQDVMDTNLRNYIGSALSTEFGGRSVDQARSSKNEIFAKVFADAKKEFAGRGITLDNFGFSEGMTYTDASIQQAINKKFEADMLKSTAQSQAEAAKNFMVAKDAIEAQQELEFKKKMNDAQADLLHAQAEMLRHWNGQVPQVVGGDSVFSSMFAGHLVNK